jgi:hypothetical protein
MLMLISPGRRTETSGMPNTLRHGKMHKLVLQEHIPTSEMAATQRTHHIALRLHRVVPHRLL